MTSKDSVSGWKLQHFPPLKMQSSGWEKQTGEDQRPISFSDHTVPVLTQKDCISVISAQHSSLPLIDVTVEDSIFQLGLADIYCLTTSISH